MCGGPRVSGILLVWCTRLLGACSYSCCLIVLSEGAEALDGGGPETCEGRVECLAEECAEGALAPLLGWGGAAAWGAVC
mgnify:CR=1 FL=1